MGVIVNRALLVIDVQNEYFSGKLPVSHPPQSMANILAALAAAARHAVRVVVIQHSALAANSPTFQKGSAGWELHQEIAKQPRDVLIEKHLPGSFTGTPLECWLQDQGIDTVTICGYMTQMCCDTTARQAFHLGLNVEFLSDATGTLDFENAAGRVTAEELHRAVLVTQQARFSRVMTTTEWIIQIGGQPKMPGITSL